MRKLNSIVWRVISMALCILLSQLAAAGVSKADTPPGETTMTLQLFRTDLHMLMPKNSVSHWFVVPASTSVSGECTLTLHVTASLTIIDELSSAIVYLNNTPIASRRLVDKTSLSTGINPSSKLEEDCYEFTWEIIFDSALLKTGESYNELKIVTTQRSIEGDCADIDNPSNWLVLHKESGLRIRFQQAVTPNVGDYYLLFHDAFSEQFTLANDFVLSDLSDTGLASSMMGLANAAGMNYQGREFLEYNVLDKTGPFTGRRNKIFLEMVDKPGGWDGLLGEVRTMPGEGQAYVSMTGANSAYPYYKLRLLGKDEAGLKRATSLFQNRTLLEIVESGGITLQSDVKPVSDRTFIERKESGQYAFVEYGYDNMTLSNVFHQQMTFSFEQPYGVMGGVGSYLDIRFRHSTGLLSERSALTVKINGVPISSVKLMPSNAGGGSILAEIPESALNEHTIYVTIEVYHYLGPLDCSKDYYDVAWTTIDTERSYVYFKESDRGITPTLENFPYFYGSAGPQEVAFVMPGTFSSDTLKAASMFATRTGQNTGMAFGWNLVGGGLEAGAGGDIVLLASRDDAAGSLPQEALDQLAIKPIAGGYLIDESVSVIPEVLAGKAVIQVIRSPWDFYRKMYVILYDGQEGLSALQNLLASKERLGGMAGQVCVIGQNGRVLASYETVPRSLAETSIPPTLESVVKRVEEFAGMPIWAAALIVLAFILLLITIIRLGRRRRDNEYKRIGDRHKLEQGFATQEADREDEQPEDGQSEGEQPENGQPEGEQPEDGQPEDGQLEGEQPENGQPEGEQPEGEQPEGEQPEDGQKE